MKPTLELKFGTAEIPRTYDYLLFAAANGSITRHQTYRLALWVEINENLYQCSKRFNQWLAYINRINRLAKLPLSSCEISKLQPGEATSAVVESSDQQPNLTSKM